MQPMKTPVILLVCPSTNSRCSSEPAQGKHLLNATRDTDISKEEKVKGAVQWHNGGPDLDLGICLAYLGFPQEDTSYKDSIQ